MTMQEAKMLLGVSKVTESEVNAQYEKLFKMNDPAKGGSFYLQCKLMGAKEALLQKKK
jgi:mitochondrial import inner membrane translocase subunit TIM16